MANKIQTFPKHMKVSFTFFCFLIAFSEAVTVHFLLYMFTNISVYL